MDAGALYPITVNKAVADLGGVFSGTVTVAPSRDPRSLEPVRIDVNVASRGGHFRSVKLGTDERVLMTHAVAYANIDDLSGFRAVLDHSDMFMAGGVVHLWGRLGTKLGTQALIVEYRGLSLDQLVHLAPAQATGDVPGTINGEMRVIRNGSGLEGLTGGGRANILDADLVNLKAIRTLYDVMQASAGGVQPVGRGGATFAIEQGTVRLTNFNFYNRGIDAHGLLAVGPVDLVDVMDTRIDGQVVGAASLLKGTKLPFLSDFDETFRALQSGLTTINVRGTLAKPEVGAAGLDELGSGLKDILVGEAQQKSGGE